MTIVFMATVVRSEFEELVQVLSCGDNVLFCGLVHKVRPQLLIIFIRIFAILVVIIAMLLTI